jgi:hypothetical protein
MAEIEKIPGSRRRAQVRFLLAALVVAVLYVEIQEFWTWVGGQLLYIGWSYDNPANTYAGQAVKLSDQSKERESVLTAMHPRAVFELGVLYGYANDTIAEGAEHPSARNLGSLVADIQKLAKFLGIGAVGAVSTSASSAPLEQLLEQDADGVAARVEQATSPRLRHLYMLGVQAGVELSRLEFPGDLIWPPSGTLIGMHGTLAGLPEDLWRPLTRVWPPKQFLGRNRQTALANYQAAVQAVFVYLQNASSPPPPAPK